MRFQYDPPSPLLLVAGHGLVVFHDKPLNQTSNIPLGQTPLGILLADHVRLPGDVTVTGMQRLPGQIQVSLVRTASPGDGTLTLIFADNPLALRQWTVLDAQRQETRVTLYNVRDRRQFDPKLFEFIDPRPCNPQFGVTFRHPCGTFMPAIAESVFILPRKSQIILPMRSPRVVKPLVGISCCTKQFGIFGMPNHAASNTYVEATDQLVHAVPVLIPANGPTADIETLLRAAGRHHADRQPLQRASQLL